LGRTFSEWIERREAFALTCSDSASAPFSVQRDDPEAYFRLEWGLTNLPKAMQDQRVSRTTLCRVLVFEYRKRNNEKSKLLPNTQCGWNTAYHVRQTRLAVTVN